jgi:hypothetical protein
MKKILIILIAVFLVVDTYCQREVSDTLFKTSVSKDTTVFRVFKRSVAYIEVEIGTFTDNDTICVGYSSDKTVLIPCSNLFPMKVVKATYKSVVNGTTKYRIGIEGDNWSSKYIGFRCKYAGTVGTCKPSIHYNP